MRSVAETRAAVAAALLVCAASGACNRNRNGASRGPAKPPAQGEAWSWSEAPAPAPASAPPERPHPPPTDRRLEVFVDVPAGLEAYSGAHAVTFGVPLPRGRLQASDPVRLVTAGGEPLATQTRVTSTWGPPDDSVRWLLVDAVVPIDRGVPEQVFLELGTPGRGGAAPGGGVRVTRKGGVVSVDTGARIFEVGAARHPLARHVLTIEDRGKRVTHATESADTRVEVETEGPVRATVKLTGRYGPYATFITRMRFQAGSAAVTLYHTIVWTSDDRPRIASLAYAPPVPGRAAGLVTGVDGRRLTARSFDLRQVAWDSVRGASGAAAGRALDGWVQWAAGDRTWFVGVRWPWQQHPMRIEAGAGGTKVHLLGAEKPVSLAARDVAVDAVKNFTSKHWDIQAHRGPYDAPISPRGVAKTYELLVWEAARGDAAATLSPEARNTLLQRPIFAYADPRFAAAAGLPSPMSSRDPSAFPDIEQAIDAAFAWATRERADEGDYGAWNFGDIQYDWLPMHRKTGSHFRLDRYWMNNGKGWSLVPWLLWMRSGQRSYRDHAEQNSRHVMDVDTCHVTYPAELKFAGGVYGYGPLHFGQQSYASDFRNDSEYLLYYYYLTGYERAQDILRERVEGMLGSYRDKPALSDIEDLASRLEGAAELGPDEGGADEGDEKVKVEGEMRFNREHYRVLGELALLYEATRDRRLLERAEHFIDVLAGAQAENGWLPGVKTNHWFGHSLNLAHRAFPTRAAKIASMLTAWERHVGDFARPGHSGTVGGPMSLWTMITLEAVTRDRTYLDVAARLARAQALSVYPEEGEVRGYTTIPIHEIGPAIRDWIVVMGRLSQLAPAARPAGYAPMPYFHSGLPIERGDAAWRGRHLLYVLDRNDADISVQLDFLGHNAGVASEVFIRVHAPGGRVTESHATLSNAPIKLKSVKRAGKAPLSKAQVSAYSKGKVVTIRKDGVKGAYAIEIYARGRELPFFARSSAGKVVHYLPTWRERIAAIDPKELNQRFYTQLPSMSSNVWSGQAWFMPADDKVELLFARRVVPTRADIPRVLARLDWPRVVALGPDGEEVCRTRISGTSPVGDPQGPSCAFSVDHRGKLHSVVTSNVNWQFRMYMSGVKPFFSSTREEWFDPTQVAHVDPRRFLTPPQ